MWRKALRTSFTTLPKNASLTGPQASVENTNPLIECGDCGKLEIFNVF
jgi:Zn finger protein HypA/HybF involved in hydrogenase expression